MHGLLARLKNIYRGHSHKIMLIINRNKRKAYMKHTENLRGRYGCPILDGSGHASGDAELREPRPFGGVRAALHAVQLHVAAEEDE